MITAENKLKNHILDCLPKNFEFDYEDDYGYLYVRNNDTDERFAINVNNVTEV